MNLSINKQSILLILGIPIFLILVLTILAKSNFFLSNPVQLSLGITFDFLITIPLVYFLLIRKTKIPKITTYLFIFVGLVIASLTIPSGHQFYLLLAKKWLLPIIEGVILIVVLNKLIKGVLNYRKNKSSYDFFTVLKSSCEKVLPGKLITAFATEIAVFYYGFLNWKVKKPKPNEFSYHRDSGIVVVLITVLFLIAIETSVIHILLAKWNETFAWIITALSIYTAIQIFGFLKSITKRYSLIENGILHLRYGILCETSIELINIKSIELSSLDIPDDSPIKKFSAFGNLETHNLIIRLKEKNEMIRPYGFKMKFKELAIFIDNKEAFKKRIENAL